MRGRPIAQLISVLNKPIIAIFIAQNLFVTIGTGLNNNLLWSPGKFGPAFAGSAGPVPPAL